MIRNRCVVNIIDIVVNGVELRRIHSYSPAGRAESLRGCPATFAGNKQARFGYMLEVAQICCPPHGIALGFDRLIAPLCGADSIRDVVAFPKTAKGSCLRTESPAAVEPRQLRDLHIDVKMAKKAE